MLRRRAFLLGALPLTAASRRFARPLARRRSRWFRCGYFGGFSRILALRRLQVDAVVSPSQLACDQGRSVVAVKRVRKEGIGGEHTVWCSLFSSIVPLARN